MARIGKAGLDYFPQNVDFLQDRTIRRLVRKHGVVTVVMLLALKSQIYGEKGYYMEWNEDVCFDLSEMVNTDMEKVHAILADTIREEVFCKEQFKENGILTSLEIQKQYLACTQKRKNVVIKEEYSLIITEPEVTDSGYSNAISAPQTTLWGEEMTVSGEETHSNRGGRQQSKGKEIESKMKEKKTTPTPPQGKVTQPSCPMGNEEGLSTESGGAKGSPDGQDGGKEEELIIVNGRKVPQYCLNKRTHNYDGLLYRLNQIHVTEMKVVNTILTISDYGRLGHPLWGIISYNNWPAYGIKFPAKYILSQLKMLI